MPSNFESRESKKPKPPDRMWKLCLWADDGILIADGKVTIDGRTYSEDQLRALWGKTVAALRMLKKWKKLNS